MGFLLTIFVDELGGV